MIRSLNYDWQQPVAYFLVSSSCTGIDLKDIIHSVTGVTVQIYIILYLSVVIYLYREYKKNTTGISVKTITAIRELHLLGGQQSYQ